VVVGSVWQLTLYLEFQRDISTSIFRIIVSGVGHALTQLVIDPQKGRTRLRTEPRGQMVEELL